MQICELVNFTLPYWERLDVGDLLNQVRDAGTMVQDDVEAKRQESSHETSEETLRMTADNLKKGITLTVSQINSRRVPPEKKLRWLKALARQAEALVDVVQALNKIGSKSTAEIDLATFLSSVEKKLPIKEARTMRRATMDFHQVVLRATGIQRVSNHGIRRR